MPTTSHSSYACFGCRKSFKRPVELAYFDVSTDTVPGVRCPNCGEETVHMGRIFAAPGMHDLKGWDRLRYAYFIERLPAVARQTWQQELQVHSRRRKAAANTARLAERAARRRGRKRRKHLSDVKNGRK